MKFWTILLLAGLAVVSAAPRYLPPVFIMCGPDTLNVSNHGAPTVGDWNRDSRKDLIVGEFQQGRVLYARNAGTDAAPVFSQVDTMQAGGAPISLPWATNHGAAPQIVDWNADGRLDLIAGGATGFIHYFRRLSNDSLNTGTRLRRSDNTEINVASNAMPFVVDWNRDSLKDLIVGNESGYVFLYINVGTDSAPVLLYRDTVRYDNGRPVFLRRMSPCMADLTRDGRLDLVCGSLDGTVRLLPNRGTDTLPKFSTLDTVALRTTTGSLIIPADGGSQSRMALADWNNDSICDILLSGWEGYVEYYAGERMDVTPIRLGAPIGTLDSGSSVVPACSVYNPGNQTALGYTVRLKIGSGYNRTVAVAGHAARTYRYVTFPACTLQTRGRVAVSCSTDLNGDMFLANNLRRESISVAVHDVGPTAIVAPTGVILRGTAVTPQARLRNFGTTREAVIVTFSIADTLYSSTIALPGGLPVGVDTVVGFENWSAEAGAWHARCSTYLANDMQHANDAVSAAFAVVVYPPGWSLLAGVPTGVSGKNVKDGGSLAWTDRDTAEKVYAFKGNNTTEFYAYDVMTNAWTTLAPIPLIGRSGRKKGVKKGASLVTVGNTVFAAKGNNTLEYWMYDPAGNRWAQTTDVPFGTKNIREGSGAALVTVGDTNFIYLMKGSGTYEFYRFNILNGTWEARSGVPSGSSGKPFKNGSCLTGDQSTTLYALKGSYNEVFRYDVDTNAWTQQAALPFVGTSGRKKKAKDGAGLAFLGGWLYALKGGNTLEFWHYECDSDRWGQLTDMPIGGGKRVRGGGALVPANGALYALKGNNMPEFYRYGINEVNGLPRADPDLSAAGNPGRTTAARLDVMPNPLSAASVVRYSVPDAGVFRLQLYDATGRLARVLAAGRDNPGSHSVFIPHATALVPGVYLLQLQTSAGATACKLLIE